MESIKNGIFTMKEKHAVCFYTVVAQETGTGNLLYNICTTYEMIEGQFYNYS